MQTCPKDGAGLVYQVRSGLCVPECPRCGGRWIPGELIARHHHRNLNPRTFAERTETRGVCPIDGASLAVVRYRGVILEVCPACAGVWLDADEWNHVHSLRRRETPLLAGSRCGGRSSVVPDLVEGAFDLATEGLGAAVECAIEFLTSW